MHVELHDCKEQAPMAALNGVLDELIETQVIDAGDIAQITGTTTPSVSRRPAAPATPRRACR